MNNNCYFSLFILLTIQIIYIIKLIIIYYLLYYNIYL